MTSSFRSSRVVKVPARRRNSAAPRIALEIPADVLAGLAHGVRLALVLAHLLDVLHHHRQALKKARPGDDAAGVRQICVDLLEDPGVPQRPAAHHHQVAAGLLQEFCGVLRAGHVAVAHDRDFHSFFDLPDDVPVGGGFIHLVARAPMGPRWRPRPLPRRFLRPPRH